MEYQIYWSHLTPEAQEAFKDLYHENIELNPLAIIDIDDSILTYEQKLKIANDYIAGKTEGMVDWNDLPDINSLHDVDEVEDIHELCDERLNDW